MIKEESVDRERKYWLNLNMNFFFFNFVNELSDQIFWENPKFRWNLEAGVL